MTLATAPQLPSDDSQVVGIGDAAAQFLNLALLANHVRALVSLAYDGPQVRTFIVHLDVGERPERIEKLSGSLASAGGVSRARVARAEDGTVYIELAKGPQERKQLSGRKMDTIPMTSSWRVPIGLSTIGEPVYMDLTDDRECHALIAGTTGAGKTVLLHWILYKLLRHNGPADLRMIAFDPKRIELDQFRDTTHLLHPVVSERDEINALLFWLDDEIDRRRQGAIPYRLLVIVDEAADIAQTFPNAKLILSRAAGIGRSLGINLILTTQHPSSKVFGESLPNLPLRLLGRVSAQHLTFTAAGRSRTQAHLLLGRGDFLYLSAGGIERRMQVPMIERMQYGMLQRTNIASSLASQMPGPLACADRAVDPRGGFGRRQLSQVELRAMTEDIAAGMPVARLEALYGIGYERAKRLHDSVYGKADER